MDVQQVCCVCRYCNQVRMIIGYTLPRLSKNGADGKVSWRTNPEPVIKRQHGSSTIQPGRGGFPFGPIFVRLNTDTGCGQSTVG